MSETLAIKDCIKCKKNTTHIYSGSGTKGMCMSCGNNLNPEERVNSKSVFYYDG